jgi:hypothetical protein
MVVCKFPISFIQVFVSRCWYSVKSKEKMFLSTPPSTLSASIVLHRSSPVILFSPIWSTIEPILIRPYWVYRFDILSPLSSLGILYSINDFLYYAHVLVSCIKLNQIHVIDKWISDRVRLNEEPSISCFLKHIKRGVLIITQVARDSPFPCKVPWKGIKAPSLLRVHDESPNDVLLWYLMFWMLWSIHLTSSNGTPNHW